MVSHNRLQICCLLFAASIFITAYGVDLFEGYSPLLLCLYGRIINGCTGERFVDAYEKTNLTESDQNINRADTRIYLFTRRNRVCAEFLHTCGGRLPTNTNFNKDKPIVIIVGGYISDVCNLAYFREFRDQFLFRGDYNVFIIKWSWGYAPDIYGALSNARIVGKQMALFMSWMVEDHGVSADQFHIIGHSVGAHIAGFAGKWFKTLTRQLIRRITGLDPANVIYTLADSKNRLDRSDAKRVDMWITNGGECFPGSIGMLKPLGHANFYVNGGEVQPNCSASILTSYMKGDSFRATASLYPPLCCHFRVLDYFAVSINPCYCQFIAFKCDSYAYKSGKCNKSCDASTDNCAVMGLDWENCDGNQTEMSTYYLDTDKWCPYCDNSGINAQGFQCRPETKGHCFVPQTKPAIEICPVVDW